MAQRYDYLIVGSGLFGATFAYRARQAGKRCLVIDKRPHLGGNVYCEPVSLPTGEGRGEAVINVHKYGAHIFHTSNKKVWDFVNSIVEFNRYTNCPVANFEGKLYNLPFNMNTFYQIFGVRTPAEAEAKLEEERAEARRAVIAKYGSLPPTRGIGGGLNLEEQAQLLIGKTIYEILIKGYTEKQWGRKCTELPAFIIKRLPVRFVFDNNYFNDSYQGIPIGGYNRLIDGLLASPQPSPVGRECPEGGSIETLVGIDLPLNVKRNKEKKENGGYRETAAPANYSQLKENAKRMRKEPTEAERAFWEMATSGVFGSKFRRQHIIGDYIVDFVCLEKNLIVEIDGGYHDDEQQQIEDNLRSTALKNDGFAILRLSNEVVIGDPQEVIRRIKLATWLAEKVPLREGFREAAAKLVYTGQIDEFFDFRFGKLNFRTVRFEQEIHDTPNYQGNAVVNYTEARVPYTRIIEHKHFEMFGQAVYDVPRTVISKEYSTEWQPGMEPYYPVNDDRNNALAEAYRKLARQEGVMFPEDLASKASPTGGGLVGAFPTSGEGRGEAIIFGGRLAEYKYYDMAPIVEKVLAMEI